MKRLDPEMLKHAREAVERFVLSLAQVERWVSLPLTTACLALIFWNDTRYAPDNAWHWLNLVGLVTWSIVLGMALGRRKAMTTQEMKGHRPGA